jgi:hypothetical protein
VGLRGHISVNRLLLLLPAGGTALPAVVPRGMATPDQAPGSSGHSRQPDEASVPTLLLLLLLLLLL